MNDSKFSNWTRGFGFKACLLFLLGLLFLIPINMVDALIRERSSYREEAFQFVKDSWGGEQNIFAPFLAIPYKEDCSSWVNLKQPDGTYKQVFETKQCESWMYIPPKSAIFKSNVQSQKRKRGIYHFPLFHSESNIQLKWNHLQEWTKKHQKTEMDWSRAKLVIKGFQPKGLIEPPKFWNDKTKGSFEDPFLDYSNTLSTDIFLNEFTDSFEGNYKIKLKGADEFFIHPTGQLNQIEIHSDWSSPSFLGGTLPSKRVITEEGFRANWEILGLNTQSPKIWKTLNSKGQKSHKVGFSLYQTINQYSVTERSTKYGFLFLILLFAFFLFSEAMLKKRNHPIQYILIGSSMILFFSLLLSFSEYFPFSLAYSIASLAVTLQISSFFWWNSKSKKATSLISMGLSILFGFLYTLLQLEDFALLVGTTGLFFILWLFMFLSSRIQWNKKTPDP